jgi:hypothetical protein
MLVVKSKYPNKQSLKLIFHVSHLKPWVIIPKIFAIDETIKYTMLKTLNICHDSKIIQKQQLSTLLVPKYIYYKWLLLLLIT